MWPPKWIIVHIFWHSLGKIYWWSLSVKLQLPLRESLETRTHRPQWVVPCHAQVLSPAFCKCRDEITWLQQKQVPKRCDVLRNSNIVTHFLRMENMKLPRKDMFDNTEHEEMIPGPKQGQMVPGRLQDWPIRTAQSITSAASFSSFWIFIGTSLYFLGVRTFCKTFFNPSV